MKNSKKGFTLVELIIVVAVIALLAAVLIPTFSSLISKANQAKDEALVSNLNKAVALSTEKYDTVYDVLGAVKENAGFDVAKISASVSEHEILWDSVNYCFVYKTTGGVKYIPETQSTTIADNEQYKFWQICDEKHPIPETQTYSIYWAGNDIDNEIKVSVGFDAGEATVNELKYVANTNAQDVIIRTKGGNLTIDAVTDSVEHHGTVDKVNVIAVAPHSYYEKGEVRGNITIKEGKLEITKQAVVNTVLLSSANVEILSEEGAKINYVAATDTNALEVIKNATTIPNEVKKTDEAVTVKDEVKNFVGGLGTEKSPYLIATGEQALKLGASAASYKLIEDVVVSNEIRVTTKSILDLNGHSITLKYDSDVTPNNGSVLYVGGSKGNLTINDSSNGQGKVIGTDESIENKVTSAVRAGNYGKLTINGGHFYGKSEETSCIFVMTSAASGSKATVTINGGIFETATPSNGTYFVLNHQDSASAGCTITVNGGKFKNYNPGVTVVDPVNAKTGKIVLGTGCKTTETKDGDVTWYIVSK